MVRVAIAGTLTNKVIVAEIAMLNAMGSPIPSKIMKLITNTNTSVMAIIESPFVFVHPLGLMLGIRHMQR